MRNRSDSRSRLLRSARGAAFAAALALLALPPRPAAAQPAPAQSAPPTPAATAALVPPRPLAPLRAEYPAGAQGDAIVVLVLTVNADGSVRDAHVDSAGHSPPPSGSGSGSGEATPSDPFAAAALAAAKGFAFAPATRDGKPAASKIRVEIRFTAPASPAPDAPPSAAAPEASTSSAPTPIEVNVRGETQAPGVSSLSQAEVRLLPGALGDPFRAIETLPGVTPIASGVPFFYVRGSPPGNIGYFLDGIRVPLLYHIGLGPSVVHPGLVGRVDLYPGGYPARFGQFAGGIVAGETMAPATTWRGQVALRAVDVGALVEAPFDDGKGAALVAGRYSYTGALLSLISPDVELAYWDYQARVGYDLTPRDRVSVFAFGAYDFLGSRDEGSDDTDILFSTTFHRVDLRYDHRYGAGSSVRQAVTLGYERTDLDEGRDVVDRMLAVRTEIDHRLRDGTPVRAGVSATFDATEADLARGPDDEDAEFTSLFSSRLDLSVSAYIESDIDVTPRLQVSPGLRADFYGSRGETAFSVDPRLSARLTLAPNVRLVQAHGLSSQPPSFILPGPGFRRPLSGGLQRNVQSSLGVEVGLPWDLSAKATVFHSAFFEMTDAFAIGAATGGTTSAFDVRALGSAAGIELSLQRRLTRRLAGLVAYSLSRSNRSFGSSRIASSYDRTHVLNVAALYDFGRGYKAGSRVLFYTGVPQTTTLADGSTRIGPGRLPGFFRLDVRLEKRWTLSNSRWLSLVFEVLNATLSKEVVDVNCIEGTCAPEAIGPVTIPSLGLEGGF